MFFILLILGLIPSLIWLSYYLRKDVHPEPNRLILKVFIGGMLVAPFAAVAETIFFRGADAFLCQREYLLCQESTLFIFGTFIGVGFIEEYAKYFVVKRAVLKSPEFDEPIDAMIYLIISALGFAALENILILVSPHVVNFFQVAFLSSGETAISLIPTTTINEAISIIFFRFLGATLLHALASGILGYFLAFSIIHKLRHTFYLRHVLYLALGIIIAAHLHTFYNYFIIGVDTEAISEAGGAQIFFQLGKEFGPTILLLGGMAIIVTYCFKRIRNVHESLRSR